MPCSLSVLLPCVFVPLVLHAILVGIKVISGGRGLSFQQTIGPLYRQQPHGRLPLERTSESFWCLGQDTPHTSGPFAHDNRKYHLERFDIEVSAHVIECSEAMRSMLERCQRCDKDVRPSSTSSPRLESTSSVTLNMGSCKNGHPLHTPTLTPHTSYPVPGALQCQ